MDQSAIEAKGAQPVLPLLRDIDGVKNRADLIRLAARFTHDGFPSFLTLGSAPDAHDSSMFIATIGQGALGLPDRDLYLNDDERSTMLRKEYAAHVQKMFELLAAAGGRARSLAGSPDQAAKAVMDVETAIARATLDRVAFRDPRRRDNPTTLAELAQLAPNIDFPLFFRGTGAPAFGRLNLLNPQYVRDINAALDALPLASWKAYMTWRALDALAPIARITLRAGAVPLQRHRAERPEGDAAAVDALQRRGGGTAGRRFARRDRRPDLHRSSGLAPTRRRAWAS